MYLSLNDVKRISCSTFIHVQNNWPLLTPSLKLIRRFINAMYFMDGSNHNFKLQQLFYSFKKELYQKTPGHPQNETAIFHKNHKN